MADVRSQQDRRAVILAAAERLLTRYGVNKTTVAEIARDSGVAVGSVYLEFESKEGIIAELSRRQYDQVLRAMRACAEAPVSFARRLRTIFDKRVELCLNLAAAGHHSSDLLHCACEAVRAEHGRFVAAEEALLSDLLLAAHAAGEFRIDEPALTARVVLRTYATFAPPRLHEEPRDELRRLLDATHELILSGLLRRG